MAGNTGLEDDRGALLIHVAFTLLGLMAFASFALDYGVLSIGRNQAQNAADAGALAGAVALSLDNSTDFSESGPAKESALAAARANLVWGEAPAVEPETDIQIFSGGGACPAPSTSDRCIGVDVYRNQARGNALPMFFGSLVGLSQQGVRATATAQVLAANASACLKPWAVADKWTENNGPGPTADFNPTGPPPDVYVPPDLTSPGTGFTLANDYGTALTLKTGDPDDPITHGWFRPLDLGVGSDFRDDISGCAGVLWGIDDVIPTESAAMADIIAATRDATEDLIDLDPYTIWNPITKRIDNSCVGATYTCAVAGYTQSPRIVAIPTFHLLDYLDTGEVRVTNILGFFIEDVIGSDVHGVLVNTAALKMSSNDVAPEASFASTVGLVR